MSAELLASKVVVQEEPPNIRTLSPVPTADAASVGITERGPIGVATLTTSFAEWSRIFGGDIADGVAAQAVRGFYENGGRVLWFTRTVHYTDITNAATKTSAAGTLVLQTPTTSPTSGLVLGTIVGPYSLTPGDTLVINVDAGGNVTATFDATQASRTSGATETFALTDGMTLTLEIDGGPTQTVTFNTSEFTAIGAATAAEVAAVINAETVGLSATVNAGAVVITSDTYGTDSGVNVTGGTANAILTFTTGLINGTGDVADIEAVTVAEIKAVVEADVPGTLVTNVGGAVQIASTTTGASSSIQVDATSTADDELGLDNATHSGTTGAAVNTLQIDGKYDGTYSAGLRILITNATSGDAGEFNLSVEEDGVIVEVFPNVSMDDAATNFVETVVNDVDSGSRLITATDLDSNPPNPDNERPANSPGATPVPYGPLTGGDDGLVGIADVDFTGDPGAKTGIHSFDTVQTLRIMFIPDRITPAVQNKMITYCEVTRDLSMFAVLDPPAGLTADGMVTYIDSNGLGGLSEFGAVYWPQVEVLNPSKSVFGDSSSIVVPPSGHVAGMYARTDASRVGGVYDPPAGVERGRLFGVVGFETDDVLEESKRDLVFPKRINPITKLPGTPIMVDGGRTLKGGGNFPSVSERRGVIFIEQTIKDGVQYARNSNNDEALRASVDRTITAFLLTQMRVGAFRSRNPDEAFFVDASAALNPPSEQFAGKLNVRIGLATQKPAEFVVLSFSQDTRALDEELATAGT